MYTFTTSFQLSGENKMAMHGGEISKKIKGRKNITSLAIKADSQLKYIGPNSHVKNRIYYI